MGDVDAYACFFLTFLLAFQIKHFVCDYLLQGKYMLGKFKPFPAYILPLLAHCAVQAIGTFLIVWFDTQTINKLVLHLTLLDFGTHFIIDRIKASPKLLGRYKPDEPYFWWALGLDQMLHQMVYIVIIFVMY